MQRVTRERISDTFDHRLDPVLQVRKMILWLEERCKWTKPEARIFINLLSDLRPQQVIAGLYTMRLLVPKEHLPK